MILAEARHWVAAMPDSPVPSLNPGRSWRKWAYELSHETFMNPHRSAGETFQLLRRLAYWKTMVKDMHHWLYDCVPCQKVRSKPVQGPMRSITGDGAMRCKVPWSDVIIDVQGPYTRAEGDNQYVLSYHCSLLRVPKLEPFKSLKTDHFSRALVTCLLRTRVIPDVVRTDRGPEMTSAVNAEFLALLSVKHVVGRHSRRDIKAPEKGHIRQL